MCGLLLAYNCGPVGHDTLGPLRRRGPDGIGFWTDGKCTIAHTRLAIVGIDDRGTEPLHDDRFVIAWNGEAYNYNRSYHTDAHWLLRTSQFPTTYVHGFGALVTYDQLSGRITLERDALGIKPLYFWWNGRKAFAASSMIQPLLNLGAPRDLDMSAIGQYARYQLTWGGRTFFSSIKKVEPGERLVREPDGTWHLIQMDDIWARKESVPPTSTWIRDTREILVECVREATMGDVPFTTTCSGGLDSSAITAILKPEHAYHANYTDPDCNETQYARLVAGRSLMVTNATEHHGAGLVDALSSIVEDFDELGVGSVILPLDDLFGAVAKRYKVVLTGTGGDELFGGYARYKLEQGEAVPGYKRTQGDWHEKGAKEWYAFDIPTRLTEDSLDFDRRVFLPALLNIDDKLAGRHGIEARPALLHQVFVRRMMEIDPTELTRGELKWLGKAIMRGILPDAVIDRKDKMGFSTPIGTMISSAASAVRDRLCSSRWRHMYRLDRVQYSAQDKWDRRLFGLLMLDLWLDRYA